MVSSEPMDDSEEREGRPVSQVMKFVAAPSCCRLEGVMSRTPQVAVVYVSSGHANRSISNIYVMAPTREDQTNHNQLRHAYEDGAERHRFVVFPILVKLSILSLPTI